jgi:hypothetical protein
MGKAAPQRSPSRARLLVLGYMVAQDAQFVATGCIGISGDEHT